MIKKELMVKSMDGFELNVRTWSPDDDVIKGVVCIVHGASEHSGRYKGIAEDLTNAGIKVFAIDLRGHGKTMGVRGHIHSYET